MSRLIKPLWSSRIAIMFVLQFALACSGRAETIGNRTDKFDLHVFPNSIDFRYLTDQQQLIVLANFSDGSTQEVTAEAQLTVKDAKIANVLSEQHVRIHPRSSGQTTILIEWKGQAIDLPVSVAEQAGPRPLHFRNDVLPVLTRAGCNTGKCHGAASGKDGFRLSLFGYDPEGDHYRLTRELSGRRINLADPLNSLLLLKAIGEVPHTGGQKVVPGSPNFRTLATWLAEGARHDSKDTPKPSGIRVMPPSVVAGEPGQTQQVVVLADYDDGSVRDVTKYAVFFSNNDAAATVTEDGLIKTTGPGPVFILARFDQFTGGTSVVVRPGTPYVEPDFVPNNYVDELTLARWRDLHLVPSKLCSDEVFLRRVYLDCTGLLPTPEQRNKFLNDATPNKRSRLIDELVNTDEFLDLWVLKLADMLQIRRANGLSTKALQLYDDWLREKVHSGAKIDQIVNELIPASGGTFENPATSYYQTETTPQLLAENLAQAFLGTRIQCAQCHNHPFDRWTMDDYYGFATFFSQIGYKQAKDPREITIYNAAEGELSHPVEGREVLAKFLGGDVAEIEQGDDYRQLLAHWLTSRDNAAFSEHIANVWWDHFMGIGIVDPVDDVRVSNPASNPALLKKLGETLVRYNFDVRQLACDICNSKTYQLETKTNQWNRWDARNFSHAQVRRLRAEVLLDCINEVTDTSDQLAGLPLGGRAVQIPDANSNNYFLETFGRGSRETPCSCEVSTSPTLSQALHLLNGETTTGKIEQGNIIQQILDTGASPIDVAREIYVKCLTREPRQDELREIESKLASAKDPRTELADLFWALLNSNEFVFNH